MNSRQSNKIYVDSTGTLTDQRTLVAYIVFTPDAANDQIILRETSAGDDILKLRGATAKESMIFDFSARPLVFQNGIHVQTLTTNATALIVTTEAGK